MLRTMFHVLFSPVYLAFFFLSIVTLIFYVFVIWLFELDAPRTKEEYYGRWP